eukprot:GFYU01017369.1.p1 GENE.GFYU01017369.1~~GFYU01017369.1.p1  ORF type:complete len:345 (-),score=24.81 GFYU01017369.1:42-1076(-)
MGATIGADPFVARSVVGDSGSHFYEREKLETLPAVDHAQETPHTVNESKQDSRNRRIEAMKQKIARINNKLSEVEKTAQEIETGFKASHDLIDSLDGKHKKEKVSSLSRIQEDLHTIEAASEVLKNDTADNDELDNLVAAASFEEEDTVADDDTAPALPADAEPVAEETEDATSLDIPDILTEDAGPTAEQTVNMDLSDHSTFAVTPLPKQGTRTIRPQPAASSRRPLGTGSRTRKPKETTVSSRQPKKKLTPAQMEKRRVEMMEKNLEKRIEIAFKTLHTDVYSPAAQISKSGGIAQRHSHNAGPSHYHSPTQADLDVSTESPANLSIEGIDWKEIESILKNV